ncbi:MULTISPECIES: o-succinylbenzoate synthase [unclassified Saccharopolyspora]|uniref:o-succinylbenzoate synthase n=1 Tax=unclassified Saccharopolyspora TaxID=2646250 RepID=UPI001CD4A576|nr:MULTISPECIES: o-succinylbenzoate synthase [unclassified Saccharopolyspora]MCA1186412.1 o-succinylbenzoate synthase [Saccharopolyspora sp. 6T]MCA1193528.1 o-succinylbenzoate synthase [Saccharopolyspora sp. 6V]MCA1228211.1 o-succinylbenzoate synthase [Saccharopolyspora sp. 6M]MCA1280108.1 o-succinylbenzoate synthase [Saccharopolyspora sp. 7B]
MTANGATISLAELDAVRVYGLPMRTRFRGITRRHGVLLGGPAGWGEFCPFEDYTDAESVPWLAAALESCAGDWPEPVRDEVPVNCTVPAVGAERAHAIAAASGCTTAKVKVAERGQDPGEDLERVAAVRDALGPSAAIRVDANAAWDVDTAIARIAELDRAAGGLEYVEQPSPTIEDLAAVRRKVQVRIAADESIRRAEDPLAVAVAEAADVAVLKAAPLGGVRRALRVAEACGLPCVVSSAVESSVGLAAQLALAGALPELPFACGLGTMSLLDGDVVSDSLVPRGGVLPVPRRAPQPDPARVAAATPTADDQRRWLDRLVRVHALLASR